MGSRRIGPQGPVIPRARCLAAQRWLPGTTIVAPISGVMSTRAAMVLMLKLTRVRLTVRFAQAVMGVRLTVRFAHTVMGLFQTKS